MVEIQAIAPRSSRKRSSSFDRLFDAAEKDTVIRLRWPLVILSSYWLYYTPSHWLTPSQVQALLIFYLLSHTTLYFLSDKLYDSPYVYGPLLSFDTLVLLAVVVMGGSATPDFFIAGLLTLVLSCICHDARGLLAVTFLAPLVYAYFVFSSATDSDANAFLRLPFPFVISLFYGYFAEVERLRRAAREKEEQAKRQQIAVEELRQQQADELRHAHKIKDGFVKSVSSELKTPLNVITGYTDMFREGLLGELTPIQEKAIETVAHQAKELQGLISSVLLVTNLEAESIHAELHDLNLWEFLAELRAAYDQPRAKNIALIWDYPADLPTVQGDRSKLKHILRNLIDNALKFTDVGTVTITVRYLAATKLLEFKIADSGVGIPAAQVAAIFERFRQVESADTRIPRGGFGLGLYVVKKFLDVLGGTIDVESHAGAGSTFTLKIPAASQEATAIEEQLQIPSSVVALK